MALYKISSSRVNNIEADQYAGSVVEEGLIWYDPNTGALRLYNGEPGGQLIGGGGTSSEIVNGTSNVRVYPSGAVTVSVAGAANVAVFDETQAEFGAVHSAGNISTDAYFIGDGSRLTGLPSGYTNANVAAYLPTYTGNLVSLQGDVTTTGNVRGSYIIGNGSLLTGITSSLPPQTGNFGKYLYTNGTSPSWQDVPGVFGLVIDGGNAERASTDFIIDGGGA
jgi:hypothetical protein